MTEITLILDLGEDALMSRVAALEKAFEQEAEAKKAPKAHGEIIRWEAIPEVRLENKPTLFGGDEFVINNINIDQVQDLLELFKKRTKVNQEQPGEKEAKLTIRQRLKMERVESVLDSRRAQAISIAMKKMQISPDHPTNFVNALQSLDQKFLTAQKIEILLACPLWPLNDEEFRLIKQRFDQGEKLADPDLLILNIITEVPDIISRVNSLAFRWEFEGQLVDAMKTAMEVKQASKLITIHENFKLIARVAVLIGNTINSESGIQIKGCTLGSLVKLAQIKSPRDKDVSVLDVIVTYCLKSYPDRVNLSDLVSVISLAKKWELSVQVKSVREMRRGLEAIRK